jgi:UDP-2,3-diacylglucosamine hydrolase
MVLIRPPFMTTLLISDLHLHPKNPLIIQGFLRFLKEHCQEINALYILGDFFDAWIGGDDPSPWIKEISQALQATASSGTAIFFMRGNRDFLVGEQFCQQAGCTLLPETQMLTIMHQNILLMHGDQLCTEDHDYQVFRRMVLEPHWQTAFLAKPFQERLDIAKQYRALSENAQSQKTMDIMDATETAIIQQCYQHQTQILIHGHTHRPQKHQHMTPNGTITRWVLGDWHQSAYYIKIDRQANISLLCFYL